MKKLLCTVLSAAFIFSVTVPAFAAQSTNQILDGNRQDRFGNVFFGKIKLVGEVLLPEEEAYAYSNNIIRVQVKDTGTIYVNPIDSDMTDS